MCGLCLLVMMSARRITLAKHLSSQRTRRCSETAGSSVWVSTGVPTRNTMTGGKRSAGVGMSTVYVRAVKCGQCRRRMRGCSAAVEVLRSSSSGLTHALCPPRKTQSPRTLRRRCGKHAGKSDEGNGTAYSKAESRCVTPLALTVTSNAELSLQIYPQVKHPPTSLHRAIIDCHERTRGPSSYAHRQ
jgi:hypothetical protein